MTRKIYRTAQGRTVDLGALQLKNENVRAVGNMSVNARGDLIDGWNRPIKTRNQEVAKQYKKQTNVSDSPVVTAAPDAKPSKKSKTRAPEVVVPPTPEDFQDDFVKPEPAAPAPAPADNNTSGGLAAAIARARQIKQEPLMTTQQIAQQTPGVRKI